MGPIGDKKERRGESHPQGRGSSRCAHLICTNSISPNSYSFIYNGLFFCYSIQTSVQIISSASFCVKCPSPSSIIHSLHLPISFDEIRLLHICWELGGDWQIGNLKIMIKINI